MESELCSIFYYMHACIYVQRFGRAKRIDFARCARHCDFFFKEEEEEAS